MSRTEDKQPNKWTVMIYMAGDNTLAGESIWALTEIQEANLEDRVEVIAFFDTSPPEVPNRQFVFGKMPGVSARKSIDLLDPQVNVFEPQVNPPTRSVLDQDSNTTKKKKKPETLKSASDFRLLQRFVEECIDKHPAEKYLLVLSGHGSGAVGDFLTSERPAASLSIPDLSIALNEIKQKLGDKKIDILGLDSCLMSMAEVAYELRDSVKLLIGSEGFAPETGWPYRHILSGLCGDEFKVSANILTEYIDYYRNFVTAGLSIDQAICDLSKLNPLTDAIKNLAQRMKRGLVKTNVQDAIILAHWKAQSYKSEQYTDLWDFCDWLEKKCPSSEKSIITACEEVKKLIESNDNSVVIGADYYGSSFQNSHGLSVFFPWKNSGSLQDYCKKSAFAKESGWGKFLLKYVKETEVEKRGESRDGDRIIKEKHEIAEITPPDSPMVIPIQSDFPSDSRVPPGGPRVPPGGPRAITSTGAMKNPPRYFLRNKKSKQSLK